MNKALVIQHLSHRVLRYLQKAFGGGGDQSPVFTDSKKGQISGHAHLVPPLNKFDGHSESCLYVQSKLYKSKGAPIEVPDLHMLTWATVLVFSSSLTVLARQSSILHFQLKCEIITLRKVPKCGAKTTSNYQMQP